MTDNIQISDRIRNVVQENSTIAGRLFDSFVIIFILYSLFVIAWETIPGLSPKTMRWLEISKTIVTLIFVVEYGLRIATAPKKKEYLFSFYGIVDFLAIAPVLLLFLPYGDQMLAVRAMRLMRIFRVAKLERYSDAMLRLGRALRASREEAILFLGATVVLLYLAAVGIYNFEHEAQPDVFSSIPASLWWALATLTTVGYGDVYPITVGGKIFTFVILMVGIGVIAVPAGLVASGLAQVREDELKSLLDEKKKIQI